MANKLHVLGNSYRTVRTAPWLRCTGHYNLPLVEAVNPSPTPPGVFFDPSLYGLTRVSAWRPCIVVLAANQQQHATNLCLHRSCCRRYAAIMQVNMVVPMDSDCEWQHASAMDGFGHALVYICRLDHEKSRSPNKTSHFNQTSLR